jgi:RNA polymerase sigma-70 factor (ECF subfamily)
MTSAQSPAIPYDELFRAHQRFLWGLCYRMTGVAADADDLVQETFVRAMEKPPRRLDEPWRPWLVRVAMNLSRDALRRRRRQKYVGPWLPSPIETDDEGPLLSYEPTLPSGETTEGRYDLLESVSLAFLVALEALTPQQRAVLLLRDAFDYSVQETADALDLSEANVKTTHHRARGAMARYDRERRTPTRALQTQTREAMEQFMTALGQGDTSAMERLLTGNAQVLSDGGGEYNAALRPIVGRQRVIRLSLGVSRHQSIADLEVRTFNGLPALVMTFTPVRERQAPRGIIAYDLDRDGKIRCIYSVFTTRKLSAVRF